MTSFFDDISYVNPYGNTMYLERGKNSQETGSDSASGILGKAEAT
jgi:hypothetical protein